MLPFLKRSSRFLIAALAVSATLLLAACGTEQPQTTFSTQGSNAREILTLYNIVFYVAVGVFIIVEGVLIFSIIRYRRRKEDGIPLQIHGNQPIEIVWTIIPAIIVLAIATMTFRTQSILVAKPVNALHVTVVGHQWWWEFRYPEFGIVTANELHIPAGREVEFSLQSADVIHSFWFPRLSGKTDAIPGHTNRISFVADATNEPLVVRGQCAEFCGGTHAQMGMHAVVEPQASFDAWVQQQQTEAIVPDGITQAAAAPDVAGTVEPIATTEAATPIPIPDVSGNSPAAGGPAAVGYGLFQSKGCIGCHAITGYPGAAGIIGPNLTHVASRQHIVAGWLENTPDNMKRWLRDPNEVKPDNIMGQAIKKDTLTPQEIDALTAYLESLK